MLNSKISVKIKSFIESIFKISNHLELDSNHEPEAQQPKTLTTTVTTPWKVNKNEAPDFLYFFDSMNDFILTLTIEFIIKNYINSEILRS